MSAWSAALIGLMPPFAAACCAALFGSTVRRLAAVELATSLGVLILVLVSFESGEPSFIDLALTLAFLALPGTLLYAHFLERWL